LPSFSSATKENRQEKKETDEEENEKLHGLLDLRDKYYELHPDERPPELEELGN
jgi:hypothetical protein